MLFMPRKPAVGSPLSVDCVKHGSLPNTANTTASKDPCVSSRQHAPTASNTTSHPPAASFSPPATTDENCSRLTIAKTDDPSDDFSGPWSFAPRSGINIAAPKDLDSCDFGPQSNFRTYFEHTSSSSNSSGAFSFAVMSSPDSDVAEEEVMPKVEEVEDEEILSLETLMDADKEDVKTDGPETNSSSGPPNVPRKRGRPRKHPVPPPNQTKVAKGRSKTGCITCRRRKKKCDETKPSCLNCQKNAVVCEGYPVKEIWKSGKQKREEIRRNSVAMIPRGLPFLIDGIETEIDRRFLDHFVYDFSKVLTLINDDSNPFKEILLPMAAQHKGLMHSLMCLSGSHLSARDPEPSLLERKHYHFASALSDLRSTIAAHSSPVEEPDLPINDPMIASTVALCLNTICEGETRGEYRSHMDAARYLLVTQRPKNEKFRQFIVEFFQYHDVSNSLTSLDRRPVCLTGDLRLPDFVPHAQAGALLGIFDGLFHYISEITVLRDRIRQRIRQGQEPSVDYQTLSDAVAIDSAIRAWEPIYPRENPNWYAAQLYRQSTWVYLYRTIRPSRANEKICQVVDDGLLFLDQLPRDAGAYSIMLMPLFLLGCSAFEQRQRDRIKEGFDSLKAYSSLRNIGPALRVVEKVWEKMDMEESDESWDWEKIIDDMNMDFLIT